MLNIEKLLVTETSRPSRNACSIAKKLDKLICEDLASKGDLFEFESAQKTLGREFT